MAGNGVPEVGLVSPLPPQVGGVASFASWLLEHERLVGCRYRTFDLRRPLDAEVGGRWRLDAAVRQFGVLGSFLRWLPRAPRVVHYCVALTASGLPRDLLFVALLRVARRRTVAHVHGPALGPERAAAKRALLRALGRLSTAHVTVAPLDGWAFLPNPLRFAPTPRSARSSPSPLRLLAVGGVGPLKGSDTLVDAVAFARGQGTHAELRFVGNEVRERDLDRLHKRVHERQLDDAVTFAGVLSPEDVQAEYERADVFCLPSRREGLPMALIEAMACDLPAVATPVGAVPLFVEDRRTGIVVAPGDVEGLAAAIVELAGDDALRAELGAAGGALARAECAPDRIAAEWRRIYAEAAT